MFGLTPSPWLVHRLGQLARRKDALAYDRQAAFPEETQQAFLQELLQRNADTEFGRLHGFADIRNPQTYAERVPIMDAETLRTWVDRTMRGERKLLTAEDPVFYASTTGTSGVPKSVPITPSYRREFQRTVSISFWNIFRKYPEAFTSKLLYYVAPRRMFTAADGLDCGYMSGFNFTEMGPVITALYAWPYELFEVEDFTTRTYLSLYLALQGDISLITGIFPLSIVSQLRALEGNLERLSFDLSRGTLDDSLVLSDAQRAFFEKQALARPDLVQRLKRAASGSTEELVTTLFPKLKLCYCWINSSASLYLPELQRRLGGDIVIRDAIYSATEAWCNVTLGDDEPGGPIALNSVYCEFIEEQAYLAGSRQTLPAHALKDSERYVIVVSASSGVYRYVIGDVIEVCGFYQATPRIRFVRKLGSMSNLAGELIDENHVNQAVGQVLAARQMEATWFCLVGDPTGDSPRYVLYIEPSPDHADLSDAALAELVHEVDEALGQVAYGYGDRRNRRVLAPMACKRVKQGSYARWRQWRIESGAGEAQLKTVHLIDNPSELPAAFQA